MSAAGVEFFRNVSLDYPLISPKIISRQSLRSQTDSIIRKFKALAQTVPLANSGVQFIMMVIRQGRIISAVHTNAFQLSMPESDQYETINNFYPHYDNASYNNVS